MIKLTLERLLQSTIAEGITQSELSCKDACAMKWNLRYNNRLTHRGYWSWTLEVGNAIHAFLDLRYNGLEADPDIVRWATPSEDVIIDGAWEAEHYYWTQVIKGMQRGYIRRYRFEEAEFDIDAAETVVEREFFGFKLQGKIDLRGHRLVSTKPLPFMMDHKSTTRPELMAPEGWDMKFQFMFYSWLVAPLMDREVFDFGINVIRKPSLRSTKNETPEAFAKRCEIDYVTRPDFYFLREYVPISKGMIEHFEEKVLLPKLELYSEGNHDWDRAPASMVNMNTNNCHSFNSLCEFLPYCRHGDVELFQYEQRKHKHEELEEAA